MKTILLAALLGTAGLALGETRTLTLRQAIEIALQQNPDVLLARLDEQKATLEVKAVSEPLLPRTVVGSGLAYTNGFPLSIEGAAPSIIRAQATRNLYNPVQRYTVAQSRELAKAQEHSTATTREDVALRVAVMYLDLERLDSGVQAVGRQLENLERVAAVTQQRVAEGRELEIEEKRARLSVARAKQRAEALAGQRRTMGHLLSSLLGLASGDAVAPAPEQNRELPAPKSEEECLAQAVSQNRELQRMESELLAKGFEARSYRASRLPKVELIAQYALFGRFNNYEDYFRTFSRHNGQLGASIQVPVFADATQEARAAQSDVEARRLKTQMAAIRNRIQDETRRAWQRVAETESAREIARLDLDVARDQVSVLLAQMEDGRATLRQLEEARYAENERWLVFYDARYSVERARLELLKETGTLTAALR